MTEPCNLNTEDILRSDTEFRLVWGQYFQELSSKVADAVRQISDTLNKRIKIETRWPNNPYPMECSNRLWETPGYTKYFPPVGSQVQLTTYYNHAYSQQRTIYAHKHTYMTVLLPFTGCHTLTYPSAWFLSDAGTGKCRWSWPAGEGLGSFHERGLWTSVGREGGSL